MYLLDQVAQAPRHITCELENGRRETLPGAGQFSNEVVECSKRYILDAQASALSLAFFRDNLDLMAPSEPLLRMPAPNMWLEWVEPSRDQNKQTSVVRVGILYEGDESGRGGRVRSFWEEDGGVVAAPGSLVFRFDEAFDCVDRSSARLDLRHTAIPEIQPLLDHVKFELDPAWSACHARLGLRRDAAITQLAETCWVDLPIALAFSILLSMKRGPFSAETTDLRWLNAARSRKRSPCLLDHTQVSLSLGDKEMRERGGTASARASPRLHQVRGHIVRRAGGMFWRSAHLRGDPASALVRQVAFVSA